MWVSVWDTADAICLHLPLKDRAEHWQLCVPWGCILCLCVCVLLSTGENRFDHFIHAAYFASTKKEVGWMTEFTHTHTHTHTHTQHTPHTTHHTHTHTQTHGFEKRSIQMRGNWHSHILVLFLFSSLPPLYPSLFHTQHEHKECTVKLAWRKWIEYSMSRQQIVWNNIQNCICSHIWFRFITVC